MSFKFVRGAVRAAVAAAVVGGAVGIAPPPDAGATGVEDPKHFWVTGTVVRASYAPTSATVERPPEAVTLSIRDGSSHVIAKRDANQTITVEIGDLARPPGIGVEFRYWQDSGVFLPVTEDDMVRDGWSSWSRGGRWSLHTGVGAELTIVGYRVTRAGLKPVGFHATLIRPAEARFDHRLIVPVKLYSRIGRDFNDVGYFYGHRPCRMTGIVTSGPLRGWKVEMNRPRLIDEDSFTFTNTSGSSISGWYVYRDYSRTPGWGKSGRITATTGDYAAFPSGVLYAPKSPCPDEAHDRALKGPVEMNIEMDFFRA